MDEPTDNRSTKDKIRETNNYEAMLGKTVESVGGNENLLEILRLLEKISVGKVELAVETLKIMMGTTRDGGAEYSADEIREMLGKIDAVSVESDPSDVVAGALGDGRV